MESDSVGNWNQETLTRFILEVIRNNPIEFGRAFKADHVEASSTLILNGQPIGGPFITGQVDGAGNVTQGTGFSVNRTGAGTYVITFLQSFATPPTTQVTITESGANRTWRAVSATPTSVTVGITTTAGAGTDTTFGFVSFTTTT